MPLEVLYLKLADSIVKASERAQKAVKVANHPVG
jgi:hypothetical protein